MDSKIQSYLSVLADKHVFFARLQYFLRPRSFFRFLVIGGINTFVNIGIFPLLYLILGKSAGTNGLLAMTFVISTSFSFLSHKVVTFKSQGPPHLEVVRFLMLSGTIYFINFVTLNVAMSLTSIHPVLLQTYTSIVLSGLLLVANYLGLNHLVFKKPAHQNEKNKNPHT